ncbi:MAG: sigma factor [Oscillospiraceae bacterium]
MDHLEDAAIISLYWHRDASSHPCYRRKIWLLTRTAVARNILRDQRDTEECVNDTYLRAWNAMPPHRPAVLSAFLGKITRNLALNRRRKDAAEKRGGGEVDGYSRSWPM